MECLYCKGRMEKATAPYGIDRKGYHIHWDAIPACVCTQCGEPYFEREEVDRIQKNSVSFRPSERCVRRVQIIHHQVARYLKELSPCA